LTLALFAAIGFLPVLRQGFIAWDDDVNILENPDFRGLGWSNLRWAWTTFHLEVYQPISWMALEFQYLLFGLNPTGYHLTSLAWHVLNTVLLYGLIVDLLERVMIGPDRARRRTIRLAAALAAALWGAHPLRVEVVAWASSQPYLPCAFFLLLALRAYLRANPVEGAKRKSWFTLATILSILSMLSKAPGIVAPALFLIMDVFPLRRLPTDVRAWVKREHRGVFLEKLPLVFASLTVMVLATKARVYEEGLFSGGVPELSRRLAKSAYSIWFYPLRTLFPVHISPYYPLPKNLCLSQPLYAVALILAALVTVWALRAWPKWTGLATLWFAYLAALLPFLATTNIGYNLVADRYSYIPLIPWTIVLARVLAHLLQRDGKQPLVTMTLGAVAGLVLAGLSWRQCGIWEDSERLFRRAFELGGQNDPLILGNLGADRLERGDLAGAERLFRLSLQVAPSDHASHFNIGLATAQTGRIDEAIEHFRAAVRLKPNFAEAHFRLGEALIRTGRSAEGQSALAEAIRIDPQFAAAHAYLAGFLAKQGRIDDAIAEYRKAARIEPESAAIQLALGSLLAGAGRIDAALASYRLAAKLEPDRAETHAVIGTLLGRQGRGDEAISALRTALRLKPSFADAHANLAVALAQKGNRSEAQAEARAALQLRPDHEGARRLLESLSREAHPAGP
jgi:tetratricopeptide (TPR) repeat protein